MRGNLVQVGKDFVINPEQIECIFPIREGENGYKEGYRCKINFKSPGSPMRFKVEVWDIIVALNS